MKDIDFDELDKAVNSLMATSAPQSAPTPPDTNTPIAAAPPALPVAPAPVPPVASATSDASNGATGVPVRSSPQVIRRSSGRFMDMVSKPTEPRTAARPASPVREGVSVTPRDDATQATPNVASGQTADQNVATPSIQAPDMPDPLSMQQPEPESPAESIAVTVAPSSKAEPAATTMQPNVLAESPFLSDAKVEKRPLNSGADDFELPQDDLSGVEAQYDQPSDDSDGQNGEDEPPAVPRVAELDSDLVAIESNEKTVGTQSVDAADATAQVVSPPTPLGASSIAQQYVSQPSSGDKSHAAIYDASQYPEPVAHPAKSRSGWLWVLWVVLLLGIGAGGALGLYHLGIIP